jgi:uncharacterized protein YdeI (BOF family)
MSPLKLVFVIPLVVALPALAQQKGATTGSTATQSQRTAGGSRGAVAIPPPTNNPFQNPIGQGVAPAANANSNRNSNVISTTPTH